MKLTILGSMLLAAISGGLLQTEPRTLYLEGREHLLEERYERALELFSRIAAGFPASEEADDAQFYLGYAYEHLGRNEEAVAAYTLLLDEWPDSPRRESARARRAALAAERPQSSRREDILEDVFRGSSSWELKRDTAFALAREGNLSAADVLEEVMVRESSSRKSELIRLLAPHHARPEARRILIQGLEPGSSTSVQLRALQALAPVVLEEDVARAIENLLTGGSSTSVALEAVRALEPHLEVPGVRRAAARALDPGLSSSVSMLACSSFSAKLLSAEIRPAVLRLLQGGSSTSVQLRCLQGLEPLGDQPAAAEILRVAVGGPSNSTSVKLEAIRIALQSNNREVQAAARAGLLSGNSTSVQIQAVQALSSGSDEEASAEAIEALFRQGSVSTSVLLAGLEALSRHLGTEAAPRALAAVLAPDRSTSVQIQAVELARGHLNDAALRRAVSSALRQDNSTSVLLKAVEVLGPETGEPEVRRALAGTLEEGFSTSVVLASIAALQSHVESDPDVKNRFVRVMETQGMSSSARVHAARSLLPGADDSLKASIADAMEEILRRSRRHGDGSGRTLDEAREILRSVDPERAERLRRR